MSVALVITALTATAVLLLLRAIKGGSRTQRVFKMAAATGFVAVALAAGAAGTDHGRVVLVALVLSWAGDLLLTLRGTRAFVGGLGAFLLAHVAFSVAFAVRGLDAPAPVVTGAAVLAGAIAVRWLLPGVPAALRTPVLAYVTAISVMVVLAFASSSADADWRLPVGALAFYASDLAVGRDRFVAPGPANRYWGLPLYFAAQLLLAWAAGG